MKREFYRIKRLPPYVFAEVNSIKAEARRRGEDVIDFGMGNPDTPTPQHIVDKLCETAQDPKSHRYSLSAGIPGLRRAQSAYYERRFGVTLDPEKEVCIAIGSKEGLSHLALAICAPGDVILVPNPAYPIHEYGFIFAEGVVKYMPRDFTRPTEEDYMEKLRAAVESSHPKPSILIVNFPCNPTAEVVSLAFYEELVEFCLFHDLIVISDLAYCDIYFDGNPPPSILQVPKAREIAVEFTTVSKTYSMAGWRMGFACGNEQLIYALKRIKSYLDYGAFTPIQVAAAAALNGPQDCVTEIRGIYQERRDVLVQGLHEAGWMVENPKASMFVWAEIPTRFQSMGSLEFSKRLLTEAHVAVSPGVGFGKYGNGHVRISLIENPHRIRQAVRSIKKFLRENK